MNLSNDYMLVLDEIRISKKIPIVDLCQNIITERTYYRMLKANQVKTDVFTQLINRLGVELSEFIHYAVFVRKNDSRFKFIYRVHTKFYRDIAEHYQAMLSYRDPVEELDLFKLLITVSGVGPRTAAGILGEKQSSTNEAVNVGDIKFVGFLSDYPNIAVLDTAGKTYLMDRMTDDINQKWSLDNSRTLPDGVNVNDIVSWNPYMFLTADGNIWYFESVADNPKWMGPITYKVE